MKSHKSGWENVKKKISSKSNRGLLASILKIHSG
jgi:hypothetical protein